MQDLSVQSLSERTDLKIDNVHALWSARLKRKWRFTRLCANAAVSRKSEGGFQVTPSISVGGVLQTSPKFSPVVMVNTMVEVTLDLSYIDLVTFGEQSKNYCRFMGKWETFMQSRASATAWQCLCLLHHCRGQAMEVVQKCSVLMQKVSHNGACWILGICLGSRCL